MMRYVPLPRIRTAAAKTIQDLEAEQGHVQGYEQPDAAAFELLREEGERLGDIAIGYEPDCDFWIVELSDADPGWGPLLYDLAIEYATRKGSGLVADRVSVSAAARRVWQHYYTHRDDVQHEPIEDLDCILLSFAAPEAINHIYYKKPVLLPALERRGLLEWIR